jgi:hypothetical protein
MSASALAMASKPKRKPWEESDFIEQRPDMCEWVCRSIPETNSAACVGTIVVLHAPVKCGKKDMCEFLAMRDKDSENISHFFLSAWHRKADDSQRKELTDHNISVYSINTKTNADRFLADLSKKGPERKLVLHLDECDYASGSKQILARVWVKIGALPNVVRIYLYSATPEEVQFSGLIGAEEEDGPATAAEDEVNDLDIVKEMRVKGSILRYTPPRNFCGPREFFKAGLLHQAEPSFKINADGRGGTLSKQMTDIISGAKESKQKLIILRLAGMPEMEPGGGGRKKKAAGEKKGAIYEFARLRAEGRFPELNGIHIFYDKEDMGTECPTDDILCPSTMEIIQWSNHLYFYQKNCIAQMTGLPVLFVNQQTATRSTELACHKFLYACHDYRPKVQYTTMSQAQERPNHYIQPGCVMHPIRQYGHLPTYKLSAGLIDYQTYLAEPTVMSLSSRVAGNIKNALIFEPPIWFPATPESFFADLQRVISRIPYLKNLKHPFKNPFEEAKKHQIDDGIWRGFNRDRQGRQQRQQSGFGWMKMEFRDGKLFQQTEPLEYLDFNCGVTAQLPRCVICYSNDILGILLTYSKGNHEQKDTLGPKQSMYAAAAASSAADEPAAKRQNTLK